MKFGSRMGRRKFVMSRVAVVEPYRLDLTVNVLRRLSTNVVDRFEGGRYVRALDGSSGPAIVAVEQREENALHVEIDAPAGEDERALALVCRMLAPDRDVRGFARAAARIPWLGPFAKRMRGVNPPRYPTLWEACVNAVVFQQVSLSAAGAILGRTVHALGQIVARDGGDLVAFPTPRAFLGASDAVLGAAGLSAAKMATLRRVGEALESGALDEAMLEERDSAGASALLCAIKGIGPWTATVVLLRGLGRLDVFPMNDSGVARSLRAFPGGVEADLAAALPTLGPWKGMLYYHLLLARLDAGGHLPAV
ncbi:MAG: DNA-3-methyladenine glycosylase 2 family protein [Candidatus Eremiobacteraeota bacterium]|nr:DNA-3-methyladenine glycosylase 2 family protein [Candidatus Eremiobacteraeota bacterium]